MMTVNQYLGVKLLEELAEVQQRVTKGLRFGWAEIQPGQKFNNLERLEQEMADMTAAVELFVDTMPEDVRENENIPPDDMVQESKERIEKYLSYSRTLGIVE